MGLMRLIGQAIAGKGPMTQRATNPFDEHFWQGVSSMSRSGVAVTPKTAVQVAAVNAAVRLLSETISSLPLILYRRLPDGGRERATDHPLYHILNDRPNEWMTRMEWIEQMIRHLLLRGNGYSQIVARRGEVEGFNPLHPDYMTVKWDGAGKKVLYKYSPPFEKPQVWTAYEVVHFKGPSEDGLCGRSPIEEARDVVGNALALDQYQSNFYANGVRMSGILEHPNVLTDETAERIGKSFAAAYAGAANSGKIAVLEEGMKFNTVSVTPRDAEFLSVRKFSITEIARIFRVPPHMIGDLENATFSNIEHESMSFVVHSIRPTTVRLEQCLERSVLRGDQESEYFIEFLLDGLLRGDMAARFAAYNIGMQTGLLKFNDARRMENMNPLPWGDATMVPLNMKIVSSIEDLKTPTPTEEPPAEDEEDPTDEDEPQDEEPADDENEEETKAGFSFLVESLTRAMKPSFEKAFQPIARRELLIADQEYRDRAEFDTKVRKVIGSHSTNVRSNLEPLVQAFADHLVGIGGIYRQRNAPLDASFITDYVSEYVGRRFDEVWTLDGDSSAITAWAGALKRNLRKTEAEDLMQRVLRTVFLTEDK